MSKDERLSTRVNKLPPAKQARICRYLDGDPRAFRRRNKVLGLRFASEDIEAWGCAATAQDVSLTDWIEATLNEAVKR